MKVMLLMPRTYSLLRTISKGFSDNGIETIEVDYEDFFNPHVNNLINRLESLPNKIKNKWKHYYIKSLNREYSRLFDLHQPGIVFIYNNQLILPETIRYFRERSKIVFFLGDNPLYTPTSEYNLPILYHADYVMSPDTFWIRQLESIGIRNLYFGVFGFDETTFYPFTPEKEDFEKFKCDLVYVGTAQKTNWGFKRFLFLNHFRNLDMKAFISGDGYYNKWKAHFPDLDKRIIPHNLNDPHFNNLVCNCSKIYPIDLVPSLFHGIHIRIMDCIGSGILPLVEYSRDLDLVFKDASIPTLKNYKDAENTARCYLNNDSKREAVVNDLREYVKINYAPKDIIGAILEKVS